MLDRLFAMYIDLKTQEEGQTMVEYALVLVFIVAIAAIALGVSSETGLGEGLVDSFGDVINAIDGA